MIRLHHIAVILLCLLALLGPFFFPASFAFILGIIVAFFFPPIAIAVGGLLDVLYFGGHGIPYFTLCGAIAAVVAAFVHEFVKTRIISM